MSARALLTPLCAVATALVGCVITTGISDRDCGDPGSHSLVQSGQCVCEPGFTWVNPDDEEDLRCQEAVPRGVGDCPDPNSFQEGNTCFCESGFDWCTDDPADLTCCPDAREPGDDAGSATGGPVTTTTAGGDTGGTPVPTGCTDDPPPAGSGPNPADCTTMTEGVTFCSHTEVDGPHGSRFWVCMGGAWVEDAAAMDAACQADAFDFAYGCVDDAMAAAVIFECGLGPGTACSCMDEACVDTDVIQICVFDKLTTESCTRFCQETGDGMGVTFDGGTCEAEPFGCHCRDE